MSKRIYCLFILISCVSCVTGEETPEMINGEETSVVNRFGTKPETFKLGTYENKFSVTKLESGDFISFEFKEKKVDIVQYIGKTIIDNVTVIVKGRMTFYFIINDEVIQTYTGTELIHEFDLIWFNENFCN